MIKFKNVSKHYGETVAVNNINLEIGSNEFVVFVGLSGSGKTTSLSMINRMTEPSSGQILIKDIDNQTIDGVELRRKIGYVIQGIGLLPHFTIYENITTVPRLLGWEEGAMRKKAEQLIQQVDLPLETLDQYPSQLSGGQQQRIGVIRALAADQDVILMDEPFGALDPITREALQEIVMNLQRNEEKTFVFVTHDIEEALKLADKIAVFEHGEIVQFDTPDAILENPKNDYVVDLLGPDRIEAARTKQLRIKDILVKETGSEDLSDQTLQESAYVVDLAEEVLTSNYSVHPVVNLANQVVGYLEKPRFLKAYQEVLQSGVALNA